MKPCIVPEQLFACSSIILYPRKIKVAFTHIYDYTKLLSRVGTDLTLHFHKELIHSKKSIMPKAHRVKFV